MTEPSSPTPASVVVVDALMGSGKTTFAIEEMVSIANEAFSFDHPPTGRRFLYITPFNEEVKRIERALASHDGRRGPAFCAFSPDAVRGRKLLGLNRLLWNRENVVSTHALFHHIDEDTASALGEARYTLFMDEVAEFVRRYEISSADLAMLLRVGYLRVDKETRRVEWDDAPAEGRQYTGKHQELRRLCRLGKIVAGPPSKGGRTEAEGTPSVPTLLLWQFPVEFLSHFERVVVLTHLFDGSDMAAYLRMHGVRVEKYTLDHNAKLVPYSLAIERERIAKIRPLVEVYSGNDLNGIGRKEGRSEPLSKSWFDTDQDAAEGKKTLTLGRCTRTFFRERCGAKSRDTLWSTFKSVKPSLSKHAYARSFLVLNARATNDYRDRTCLAYLCNVFRHPFIKNYFDHRGVETFEDFYALSTLTQWIWRSAIRDGKPIRVYVPSERMRRLLCDFLEGKLPEAPSGTDAAPSDRFSFTPLVLPRNDCIDA